MLDSSTQSIIVFTISIVLLMAIFCSFIVTILYRYQQKQNTYLKELEALKIEHENDLLKAQLEMQEYTFQSISREIHDNIGQKLSLVKLYLNTVTDSVESPCPVQVTNSVLIIAQAINDLSDIARSMNSEIIINEGLVKGIEFEVLQLRKSGLYEINLAITGNTIFFDFKNEIIVFRIIQEALHNIMKHANATEIDIGLHYTATHLCFSISDNGSGFVQETKNGGSGLNNIKRRVSLLEGTLKINTGEDGTQLITTIPIKQINNDSNDLTGR
ncbi:MAG: ATP-binding protein [Ferruginibacter sp.]